MESTLRKKFLNLEEKMLVVKKLNDGVSIRKIAEEFRCGKTQIANIRENKESVKRQWEAGVPNETGLYYRSLPQRSLVLKSDKRKGIKTAKERITVLLACSQTGEKLPPLVIGYAENPRCFKGRKILLFVDNCSAHPEISMSNVIVKYLPPKTTSCLQPLDAGIISQIKAIYRKKLLRHVLTDMEEADTARELAKFVNLLNAINWLDVAWRNVNPTSITKCFNKCGFGIGENIDTDVQLIETDPSITSLLGSVTWENFVTMDNNDDSTHSPQSSENHEQFKVQDDEEEKEAPVQEVSTKMALQCARKLISYSIHMGNRELLQFSENIENVLEIELLKTKCFGKQTTMNDFLP
ncbi:hypothetical protein HELRODRAFT_165651 [Helobdella robusta]|uniref:DDE-1 domain-containing protein n=1 Tax=Helobdella robusta TaxID=6412 RepID=T1EX46_HELRO|nr:hypothetical protein HELRODRAFT_165651 [Helobdella robusta]ESN91598.1 hypothetical protein HELRODRAFT_165651 [Helobdella robusta]